MSTVKNGFRQEQGGDKNAPFFENTNVVTNASFAFTAGAANVAEVAISLLDGAGDLVTQAIPFEVWLSDAANGAGLTGTTASGNVQAKAAYGADFGDFYKGEKRGLGIGAGGKTNASQSVAAMLD